MLDLAETLLVLAAAGWTTSMVCTVQAAPFLDPRAPHFAALEQPLPDYVLVMNDTSATNASFQLTYSNGERYEPTTCSVSLANTTSSWYLAENLTFYNSYWLNATLDVSAALFADGNYSLTVEEWYEGSTTSEVTQPFAIAHSADATASTGSAQLVDPSASATSTSAWSSDSGSSATIPQDTPTSAPAATSGSIEDQMNSFLQAISSAIS